MRPTYPKHTHHQQILTQYLEALAEAKNSNPQAPLTYQVLTDLPRGHYQLSRMGWHQRRFHFQVLLHMDLAADGKVWLQQNNTDILIGEELVARGIAPSDIVVGFRPEYLREGTRYAVR